MAPPPATAVADAMTSAGNAPRFADEYRHHGCDQGLSLALAHRPHAGCPAASSSQAGTLAYQTY